LRANRNFVIALANALPGTDGRRAELQAVISRACALNPDERYQNAAEMLDAVSSLVRAVRFSREVVPLLYENAANVWLGFKDPTLPLPQIVEKVFSRRFVIEQPYRVTETVTWALHTS
jgi:hypothetical protein